ncbi:MarR family winged helix-turn-helix transcriptional regulator [Gryllotalpicola protaetiae]|uniref:MarR family transcriptional regulator n=1 Tax=Gryllotalpicola protaetiae TaxID=2419771 RepID=A0A387BIW1_9MICO|nr:MarR family transcriptional regulator [Gryllotalpicola protaetiae]AYG04025.1 MarR family transcriptional regulator [Gryllotalpicola protaetiae]
MAQRTDLHTLLGDLVQANSRLVRIAAQKTGSTESSATWRTLGVLQQSGPMRVGELATLSRVAQPTMTKLVSGLAERGWARRVADPDDARAAQIAVTAAGVAAVDAWRDELASALHPYFADLDAGELDALRRTVALLQERVELNDPVAAGTHNRTKELSH